MISYHDIISCFEGVCVTTVILAPGACGREVRACSPTPHFRTIRRIRCKMTVGSYLLSKIFLFLIFSENDRSFLLSGLHGSACWPARVLPSGPSGLHQATGQTRCRPLGRQACARQGCRISAFERVEKILSGESLLAPDSSQIF